MRPPSLPALLLAVAETSTVPAVIRDCRFARSAGALLDKAVQERSSFLPPVAPKGSGCFDVMRVGIRKLQFYWSARLCQGHTMGRGFENLKVEAACSGPLLSWRRRRGWQCRADRNLRVRSRWRLPTLLTLSELVHRNSVGLGWGSREGWEGRMYNGFNCSDNGTDIGF